MITYIAKIRAKVLSHSYSSVDASLQTLSNIIDFIIRLRVRRDLLPISCQRFAYSRQSKDIRPTIVNYYLQNIGFDEVVRYGMFVNVIEEIAAKTGCEK